MRKNMILFTIGGGAYVSLELLWRGRSHWTMFCLGGGCFLAIGKLDRTWPLWVRSVIGSGICTIGELLTGLVFNSDYRIWDYRQAPCNFRGQICLPFTLLWVPVSALAAVLFEQLDQRMAKKQKLFLPKWHAVLYNAKVHCKITKNQGEFLYKWNI